MTQHHEDLDQHAAVMAVITRETDAFLAQDFDCWSACWVQESRTREVCVSSSFGATVLEGWEQLSTYMRNVMESDATCKIAQVERFNIVITIRSDMAHVTFEEQSENDRRRIESTFETRVLERVNDEWRILYASFITRGHQLIDATALSVDKKGELLSPLREAQALVEGHPVLQISNNRLRASKLEWDKTLQSALATAAQQHGYFEHYKYMTESGQNFRLPIVFGESSEGSVVVCVLYVRNGITFVEMQNDKDMARRLTVAKSVFGLSEGQMLLADRIVSGDSLTHAAMHLGISVNTARTHLSRIYVKTGVNSQTALVRTLLSIG